MHVKKIEGEKPELQHREGNIKKVALLSLSFSLSFSLHSFAPLLLSPKSLSSYSPYQLNCFSASPCPWKNKKLRAKSATKIPTREITTADVVDSPTPFAPPVVVVPQEQETTEIIAPKTHDLMQEVATSQGMTALIFLLFVFVGQQ